VKRRAEYLVKKRDGRREWLRATKLARSIHLALTAAGIDERGAALELATELVGDLHRQGRAGSLSTDELAVRVRGLLAARGYTLAAVLYAEAGARRRTADRSGLFADDRLAPNADQPFWTDERWFRPS
jgi:hypothetical protein